MSRTVFATVCLLLTLSLAGWHASSASALIAVPPDDCARSIELAYVSTDLQYVPSGTTISVTVRAVDTCNADAYKSVPLWLNVANVQEPAMTAISCAGGEQDPIDRGQFDPSGSKMICMTDENAEMTFDLTTFVGAAGGGLDDVVAVVKLYSDRVNNAGEATQYITQFGWYTTEDTSPQTADVLGDSFSSGEGATSFIDGTGGVNDSGNNSNRENRCHRSQTAWGLDVAEYVVGSQDQTAFGACSGATIRDFYHPNRDNGGEVRQLDQVRSSSSLVTMTLGGNDLGFASLLADCIGGVKVRGGTGCGARNVERFETALDWLKTGRSLDDAEDDGRCFTLPGIKNARNPEPAEICGTAKPLHRVYEDVASRMRDNGRLVVAGYPRLFGDPDDLTGSCLVYSPGAADYRIANIDIEALNKFVAKANNAIGQQVRLANRRLEARGETVQVTFVSVDAAFNKHRICDKKGPWFNTLLLNGLSPKQTSFHPNASGQAAYSSAVKSGI